MWQIGAGKNGCGTRTSSSRLRARAVLSLLLVVLLSATAPCAAWSVPGSSGSCTERFGDESSWYETEKHCQFAAQLEPDGVLVGGEQALGTGYYTHPHVYQIENSIRLFREKGYDNWALYLSSPDRFQALADGVTWADAYKGRLVVHFAIHVLFVEVYSDDFDICNYAGFDQYYNSYSADPAGKGLDAENLDVLANSLPVLIKTIGPAVVELAGAIAGVPGLGGLLASVNAEVRPSLAGEYPSGALQAQQHYDKAIGYHFGSATDPATGKSTLYWPQRSPEYNSLFQLGWTTHLLQDIGVIYHLRDIMSSFPPNPHNDFEDDAQGHGDMNDGVSNDYHVSASGWTLGTDYEKKTITALARDEALAVDDENDWVPARSQNPDVRRPVVQKGSRISEQFTAAVIAKYLTETGIPKVKQPFQGRVEDLQNNPVPYAYVFYRKGLQCVQDPDKPVLCGTLPGAWNYVRADKDGVYVLDLKPSDTSTLDTCLVRPAMPGFRYAGHQQGSSSELVGAILDGKPLAYKPPWKSVAVTVNPYYELYLAPVEGNKAAAAPALLTVQPSALTFLPADLTPSSADALRQDLISVNPESPVLRVHTTDAFQQQMIPLPETSYVEVRLANLVDLNTPRVLTSPATIRSTVLAAQDRKAAFYLMQKTEPASAAPPAGGAALKSTGTSPALFIPASTPGGWHEALSRLPRTRVKAPNGTMVEVADLSFAFGASPALSREYLLANGMARVPARNAQVEVTLEPGPGAIGPGFLDLYPGTAMAKVPAMPLAGEGPGQPVTGAGPATLPGCLDATGSGGCPGTAAALKGSSKADPVKKSLTLTTDDTGRAALLLQSGNQAGRIRLHVRVTGNPDAPGVLPEDTVEFMVHPPFNEPDPGSVVPPVIMAVEPREEVEEAGGKTDAGPSKPPVLCYRIMPDMSATVVPCPERPVPVQVLDLVSSVTSVIGQVPAMLWPPSSLQAGEEGPCDDGNACTVLDRTVRGTCTGDRVICIPAGRCNPASGCVYEPDEGSRTPLPVEAVTTATGMTRRTTDVPEAAVPAEGSACDDGNACTARDAIRDGTCQGRPVVCDDGDGMTSDACDPGSGCMHTRRERVPETTAPAAEREPEAIPEATPVVLEIVATIVPDACPEGCSCVTEAEARERFGRYLPCSDRPCGTTESREGTVQKYCLRPAM